MLAFLQKIGKSLMFPIATLPAAALLLRLGAEDIFDIPFMAAAGAGILDNLALIFAIGIAMGFAKDGSGAAALAGAVGYLVLTSGIESINAELDLGVFAGIIAGISGGLLYNRFHTVKFPEWLAFFGGKRFVPIITAASMVVAAGILGYAWVPVQTAIDATGNWVLNAGALGVGVYGFLNRLLIPVGLHHVINTIVWFDFGSFTSADGEVVRGEINRFLKGDPTAGPFLSGFFPIMMFGLPAACLAMYFAAYKKNRAAVGGMFLSIGLTAFLTGITEPIEFLFMFLSPLLYGIHAVLTGISMVITYFLDIKHGFGFSAGLIDYGLNFGLATNPLLIIPVGLVMGAVYFVIFYFLIKKLDLKTPGREDDDLSVEQQDAFEKNDQAEAMITGLGGSQNIDVIDHCTTRLRLQLKDTSQIDEKILRQAGSKGVIKINSVNVQVVIGTNVEFLADAMKKSMKDPEK